MKIAIRANPRLCNRQETICNSVRDYVLRINLHVIVRSPFECNSISSYNNIVLQFPSGQGIMALDYSPKLPSALNFYRRYIIRSLMNYLFINQITTGFRSKGNRCVSFFPFFPCFFSFFLFQRARQVLSNRDEKGHVWKWRLQEERDKSYFPFFSEAGCFKIQYVVN